MTQTAINLAAALDDLCRAAGVSPANPVVSHRPDDGERLVTVREAAALVNHPRSTLTSWHYKGHLPAERVAADVPGLPRLMFRVADVLAAAARNEACKKAQNTRRGMRRAPKVGRSIVPASAPTDARPGSEERLKVYEERVKRGQSLFHPADLTLRTADDGNATTLALLRRETA